METDGALRKGDLSRPCIIYLFVFNTLWWLVIGVLGDGSGSDGMEVVRHVRPQLLPRAEEISSIYSDIDSVFMASEPDELGTYTPGSSHTPDQMGIYPSSEIRGSDGRNGGDSAEFVWPKDGERHLLYDSHVGTQHRGDVLRELANETFEKYRCRSG